MPKLQDEFENVIKVKFPGADKRKVAKFAQALTEELRDSPSVIREKFLMAAPKLFEYELSEEDVKSAVKITRRVYADNTFVGFAGSLGVETIGKLLKSTDEIFVTNFLKAGLLLEKKAPLALLMYLSDEVAEGVVRNRFSPAGVFKWVEELLKLTADGKAVDLLLDYLFFRDDLYANMDLSRFSMHTTAVFYDDVALELESLVRLHYNKRLVTKKSVEGSAHTLEGDEVSIFLPYYIDTMDTMEGNKGIYHILADHEAGHIHYGSFRALLPAFLSYIQRELGKEIVVKKLAFADSTGMKLKNITYEYEGKTYFANSLLAFISMFGEEYAEIVKDLWNCIEDGKDDAWWLDEKAYGLRGEYLKATYIQANEKGAPLLDYSITGMRNQILLFVRGYAGATNRDEFTRAVFSGKTDGLTDEEKMVVELIRKCDPKTLAFLEKHSDELINTITKRVYHTTPVILLTFRIVSEWKQMVEKGEIKKPEKEKEGRGRIGSTGVVELDPKNISFEVGDENTSIPLDELPEDLKKQFMDKFRDFWDNLDDESKKELEKKMKRREGKMKKDQVSFDRDSFVLEYDPNLGKVSPNLQIPIHIRKALDCESMADQEVVRQLSVIFKRLAQSREQIIYVEEGEEIDIDRRYEYVLDKRVGIKRDKDYYISKKIVEMRNVAIEIVVDASGSTSGVINGKRVIDYLTEATHTTVAALSGIQQIKLGYSFYQSDGPVNGTTIYVGKHIDEKEVRYRKVNPDVANRDGAARRAAIERLLQRKEPIKILIFICDSLPADSDYGASVDDVRDARIEGEKKGIIQMTITTPVEKSHFSSVPRCNTMEEYLTYMYGENWYVITSQKDLIYAYEMFFRSVIRKLKSTKVVG